MQEKNFEKTYRPKTNHYLQRTDNKQTIQSILNSQCWAWVNSDEFLLTS